MNKLKGKHAVFEALNSDTRIERILVDFKVKDRDDIQKIITIARKKSIKIQICSPADFYKNAREENTQGILAYLRTKKLLDLDHVLSNKNNYPFIVVVDHLEDPYNFGAIMRTCEFFGVKVVIFPKDRNCQITPGVIKASSGAVNHLNMIKVVNIAQTLNSLSKNGYWLYGADSNEGTTLESFSPALPLVLVVGNENRGLSKHIQKIINDKIKIPRSGKTDSLNVSVATGIIIHSLIKQAVHSVR
ncbi:23S rRNA (guanosine(2251)-2'-O)-methyltransferase RlmB [Candidatus Margulisiibacteriota bacterium]